MTLQQSLTNVQNELEKMVRNHKFKKANKERNAATQERVAIMHCNGQLNQSLLKFSTTIRQQSLQIQEGLKYHRDTVLQEQTLWDAAIGYMLVQDAKYALGSLYSYDSVEYAYGLLNKVTKYMNGDRLVLPTIAGVRRSKERNFAGYMTSDAEYQQKSDFLDTFFEDLKKSGDIEACMKKARSQADTEASRRASVGSYQGGDSVQYLREAMNSVPDSDGSANYEIPEPTGNINVPNPTAAAMETSAVSAETDALHNALNSIPDETSAN